MQLNDLKSAWKQLQLSNAMQHIEADEILSIIEFDENVKNMKTQRILAQVVVFVVLTILCQGG